MKRVIINESQSKRLFEAYREGFSFDELTQIADSAFAEENNSVPQMAYCRKWLGQPSFMGSSRAVFTLSDNIVLKLAYGKKYRAGIAQNKTEAKIFEEMSSPLLVRVLDYDKNYTYLVCEGVVPAEAVDFEKILGLPFYRWYTQSSKKVEDPDSPHGGDAMIGYNEYFPNLRKDVGLNYGELCVKEIMDYIESRYVLRRGDVNVEIERVINSSEWFSELVRLALLTKLGDLSRVENFGIVNRNGNPSIVILDSGLDIDVWQKYYLKF